MGFKLVYNDLQNETKKFLATRIPDLSSETKEVEITEDIYNYLTREWRKNPAYEDIFNDILHQAEILEGKKLQIVLRLDRLSAETRKILRSEIHDEDAKEEVTIYGNVLHDLIIKGNYSPAYEDVLLDILKQENVESAAISKIIKETRRNSVFKAALKHKNTLPKDIREYMYDSEDRVKIKVAEIYLCNQYVTAKNIRGLAEYVAESYEGMNIFLQISKNPKTDADTLRWLVTDQRNLHWLPSDLLEELKLNIAKHPNAPKDLLLDLSANTDNDQIRLAVLENII